MQPPANISFVQIAVVSRAFFFFASPYDVLA
jgi:hypothetical protein